MIPILLATALVATATVNLRRVEPASINPNAEYMSIGPLERDTSAIAGETEFQVDSLAHPSRFHSVEHPVGKRLRVTIIKSENLVYLTIDDIEIGRADSRRVIAEYEVNPYSAPELRSSWSKLRKAPRIGGEPSGPPIRWLSARSFDWITRADTIAFHQASDSLFRITVRPRVR